MDRTPCDRHFYIEQSFPADQILLQLQKMAEFACSNGDSRSLPEVSTSPGCPSHVVRNQPTWTGTFSSQFWFLTRVSWLSRTEYPPIVSKATQWIHSRESNRSRSRHACIGFFILLPFVSLVCCTGCWDLELTSV
jgi:hypothetical protein